MENNKDDLLNEFINFYDKNNELDTNIDLAKTYKSNGNKITPLDVAKLLGMEDLYKKAEKLNSEEEI